MSADPSASMSNRKKPLALPGPPCSSASPPNRMMRSTRNHGSSAMTPGMASAAELSDESTRPPVDEVAKHRPERQVRAGQGQPHVLVRRHGLARQPAHGEQAVLIRRVG